MDESATITITLSVHAPAASARSMRPEISRQKRRNRQVIAE
jgi:hypothetical protein